MPAPTLAASGNCIQLVLQDNAFFEMNPTSEPSTKRPILFSPKIHQYNTLLSLCTSFNKISPCLTTVSYCAFFSDGRVVSTIPFTLSIEQCNRPLAIKRDSSLQTLSIIDYKHSCNKAYLSTKSTLTPNAAPRLSRVRLRYDSSSCMYARMRISRT